MLNIQTPTTSATLAKDLLILAEAFKVGDPAADHHVFELLTAAAKDLERFAFCNAVNFTPALREPLDRHPDMAWAQEFDPKDEQEMREFFDRGLRVAVDLGLWPLKDGAK